MGFRSPAKVEFDRMDLSNEEAEKSLLIQLADRNIVSDELIQTRFSFDPDMERTRLNEDRDRKKDRMVGKASPYHDPEPENALKKIALQSGVASPSEVGLELDPKKKEKKFTRNAAKVKPAKLAKDSPESLPENRSKDDPNYQKIQRNEKNERSRPRQEHHCSYGLQKLRER